MRASSLLTLLCLATVAGAQDAIVPFTSSNLPIVVINTNGLAILDDPKIEADMGIIDNGTERNNITDPFNDYSGKIGIEIRGSSSQMFPKKQYGIELWDDDHEGIDASLLGLPEEEDWVLFAPYNDKSLMRDVMAYTLGRGLSGYAPRTKYCEVVLNGVYQGVYVLIEKIKRDKQRVDINKLDSDEISGNSLTGGYIFKIDKTTGGTGEGWTSSYSPPSATGQTIYYQYEDPEPEDIVPAQAMYIQSFVKQFEDALHGDNFRDTENGYTKFIDVNSFVDYLIMQEITRNVDGYRLSTFMYKQRDSDGGKLHMGPIWDFNLGFGNADYCDGGATDGWALDFNRVCPTDFWLIPFWWDRLFKDPSFGDKLGTRWSELRTGQFRTDRIHARIDSITTLLSEAHGRNFTAWNVLGTYVWPNSYIGSSFDDEVRYLKQWIDARLRWMDANMPGLITSLEEIPGATVSAAPNPFTETVGIRYSVEGEATVTVRIFDALGRIVNNPVAAPALPGDHEYRWDGSRSGPGIYYYQVRTQTRLLGAGKISRR